MWEYRTLLDMTQPTYLHVPGVVARLAEQGVQVSDETVYRWLRSGELPFRRVSKRSRYLIRPEDVDALLEPAGSAA
jgi:excisionase family DNA binding protein